MMLINKLLLISLWLITVASCRLVMADVWDDANKGLLQGYEGWLKTRNNNHHKEVIVYPDTEYARSLEFRGAKRITKPTVIIKPAVGERYVRFGGDGQAKSGAITARLVLMNKHNVCVALQLKNNSTQDIYIEIPTVSSRGTLHSPRFKILSTTDKEYSYIGPLDMRYNLSLRDYERIGVGRTVTGFYCLGEYYALDGKVETIQYDSITSYYQLQGSNYLYILGYQDTKSNTIQFKAAKPYINSDKSRRP